MIRDPSLRDTLQSIEFDFQALMEFYSKSKSCYGAKAKPSCPTTFSHSQLQLKHSVLHTHSPTIKLTADIKSSLFSLAGIHDISFCY